MCNLCNKDDNEKILALCGRQAVEKRGESVDQVALLVTFHRRNADHHGHWGETYMTSARLLLTRLRRKWFVCDVDTYLLGVPVPGPRWARDSPGAA